jgi:hypothetical protein
LGKNRQAKYIQFSSGEMLEIKRAIPKVGWNWNANNLGILEWVV